MTASSSVGGRQIQKISCRKFFFIIWTSLSVFHSGNCRQRRVPFEYTVGVIVGRGTRRLMLARSESRSAGPAIAWWPRTLTTTQSGKNMTCGLGDPARRPVDRRYTRQWVSEWVAQGKQEETGERKRSEVTARRRHARSDLYGRLNDVRCVATRRSSVRPFVRARITYCCIHRCAHDISRTFSGGFLCRLWSSSSSAAAAWCVYWRRATVISYNSSSFSAVVATIWKSLFTTYGSTIQQK